MTENTTNEIARLTLELPRELHSRIKAEAALRRVTLTKAVMDGLRMWSETEPPADQLSAEEQRFTAAFLKLLRASDLSPTEEEIRRTMMRQLEIFSTVKKM